MMKLEGGHHQNARCCGRNRGLGARISRLRSFLDFSSSLALSSVIFFSNIAFIINWLWPLNSRTRCLNLRTGKIPPLLVVSRTEFLSVLPWIEESED